MTAFGDPIGLCSSCVMVRRIENARGSVFHLCQRATTDPRFSKYPPLPVLACPGYENNSSEENQ